MRDSSSRFRMWPPAEECRFRDCSHRTEPGCAVVRAIERGTLSPDRLQAYQALDREADVFETKRRQKQGARAIRAWKKLHDR